MLQVVFHIIYTLPALTSLLCVLIFTVKIDGKIDLIETLAICLCPIVNIAALFIMIDDIVYEKELRPIIKENYVYALPLLTLLGVFFI